MVLFDSFANGYEDWYKTPVGSAVYKCEANLLLKALKDCQDKLLLDIGCGTGSFSKLFATSGFNVTGIDESQEMLKYAYEKLKDDKLTFIQGDALNLPFSNNVFDICTFVTSLEFIPDQQAALKEALRVLKPNGKLVVGTINAKGLWAKAYKEFGGLFAHATFLDAEKLSEMTDLQGEHYSVLHFPINISEEEINENLINEDLKQINSTEGGFLVSIFTKGR